MVNSGLKGLMRHCLTNVFLILFYNDHLTSHGNNALSWLFILQSSWVNLSFEVVGRGCDRLGR